MIFLWLKNFPLSLQDFLLFFVAIHNSIYSIIFSYTYKIFFLSKIEIMKIFCKNLQRFAKISKNKWQWIENRINKRECIPFLQHEAPAWKILTKSKNDKKNNNKKSKHVGKSFLFHTDSCYSLFDIFSYNNVAQKVQTILTY